MQEETNEKTIALYIKTGKLTAQQLQKAMKALLAQMKKQHDRQKIPHGKQTLKQLMKQNAGVSNIEITKDNIKAFESTAKKYGIDFALKKDSTEIPPRYLVFFEGNNQLSDRGLLFLRQLLCGKLLESCGQCVRVPSLEENKIAGRDFGAVFL